MTDDNVTRLPEPGVILDLNTVERPKKSIRPPFRVTVGDRVVEFADPDSIDWKILAEVQLPVDLVRVSLSREDRDHILSSDLPGWKFNALMEAYNEHFGLEDKIREAKRRHQFGV